MLSIEVITLHSNIYEKHSVNKLILTFSLPAIASLLVETLTIVVDTSFAGHLGEDSEYALAALGLLSPVMTFFLALQTLFAMSTAIMISTQMGTDNPFRINNYFQTGVLMTLLISIGASVFTWIGMDEILVSLHASGAIYTQAKQYLSFILLSNVFSSIGYTMTSVIRAFGYPKMEMLLISFSVVVNIVANAILTFGMSLGIQGIALGTLISEFVCALIAIVFLLRKNLMFRIKKISVIDTLKMVYEMAKIGLAQTLIQLLGGISALVINEQLMQTGSSGYVATWNIANKIYMLMIMPIVGITQAVQTIISYFNGKGEESKKNLTVKRTILICFIYGVFSTMIVLFGGKYMLYLFTTDKEIFGKVMAIIKVIFLTFPLLGITYTIMTLLQVTGKELRAVSLGVIRQVITIIPLVFMLPYLFSSWEIGGIDAAFSIFFAVPVADLLTLLVAIYFIVSKERPSS